MDTVRIPFLDSTVIRSTSRIFIGIGAILMHIFPGMKVAIDQSGVRDTYKIDSREYMAFVFFVSLMMFVGLGGLVTGILVAGEAELPLLGPLIGGSMCLVFFMYLMMYPQQIVSSRVKMIERNLLFALRSLLVQIRSGVPLFNAMASIAMGNYGAISEEFKKVVEKVNAGSPVVEVLDELANRNPSIHFRRALWQMVNSMKSGSDVGKNLEDIIRSLSKEQLVEISQYKSTLNPLAMMYMMVAVIAPSLGITMIIILSFFPGMEGLADERVFYGLFVGTIFMQFVFLGIIKSKRPNLIGN